MFGHRYLQCLLLFTGFLLIFALRVNISIAIVAMMDNKAANPDFPVSELSFLYRTENIYIYNRTLAGIRVVRANQIVHSKQLVLRFHFTADSRWWVGASSRWSHFYAD